MVSGAQDLKNIKLISLSGTTEAVKYDSEKPRGKEKTKQ